MMLHKARYCTYVLSDELHTNHSMEEHSVAYTTIIQSLGPIQTNTHFLH